MRSANVSNANRVISDTSSSAAPEVMPSQMLAADRATSLAGSAALNASIVLLFWSVPKGG